MKKVISIAILLVCFLAVVFYMHREPCQPELIPQNEFIFNQLTRKYRFEKVYELIEQGTEMMDLFKKLGITQFKCVNGVFYTIIDTSDRGLVQIQFDSSGKYTIALKIEVSPYEKSEFDQLREGMTFDDVLKVDPTAVLDTSSWSKAPQLTYHFSKDGYAFRIWYESGVITDILCWTI